MNRVNAALLIENIRDLRGIKYILEQQIGKLASQNRLSEVNLGLIQELDLARFACSETIKHLAKFEMRAKGILLHEKTKRRSKTQPLQKKHPSAVQSKSGRVSRSR